MKLFSQNTIKVITLFMAVIFSGEITARLIRVKNTPRLTTVWVTISSAFHFIFQLDLLLKNRLRNLWFKNIYLTRIKSTHSSSPLSRKFFHN